MIQGCLKSLIKGVFKSVSSVSRIFWVFFKNVLKGTQNSGSVFMKFKHSCSVYVRSLKWVLFIITLRSINFYFALFISVVFCQYVILKDMTKLKNEDKMGCEQKKLNQNMIVCWKSLEASSIKEILPLSHKYLDTQEMLTLCV